MKTRGAPDEETSNWRAVCGRTARTVRRAGRRCLPDPYRGRIVACGTSTARAAGIMRRASTGVTERSDAVDATATRELAQRTVRLRSSVHCSHCLARHHAMRSAAGQQRSAARTKLSTWRLDGAAPSAWAASPYSAFTSSHRNRSASAGVSCPTTLGSSPARNRAANAGHAGGDWKLNPTVVRPKRACACRHRGMINASSAANDAAQASGVAGIAVTLGSAGACQPGVSCRPGGSSAKSSRITGPSVRSSSRNAASTMRRWNALSSGSPTGRPSCADVHRPRGGRVFSICARTEPSATLAIPRSSSMWASAHTARVQRGQTGLSRTASIRSCRNCPAIWSAASVMPAGSVEPITV